MKKLVVFLLISGLCPSFVAYGYHEFQTPKKAYKKATIEYFSNEKQKTKPDSTVTIYYDKNDVEMYRQVKKGCGNVIGNQRREITRHPIGEIDPFFWGGDTLPDISIDSLCFDSAFFVY